MFSSYLTAIERIEKKTKKILEIFNVAKEEYQKILENVTIGKMNSKKQNKFSKKLQQQQKQK